jgi:hypothetical protein
MHIVFLPRTRDGWITLAVITVAAVLVGGSVSSVWGPFAFGLTAFYFGAGVIAFAEAWRADVWRDASPPPHITPGQVPDYIMWRLRQARMRA